MPSHAPAVRRTVDDGPASTHDPSLRGGPFDGPYHDRGHPDTKAASRLVTAALVLVTVAMAAMWPLGWINRYGSTTAVLGAGHDGPSKALIVEEIPHAVAFPSWGHDGQQFYTVARSPLDPAEARDDLDWPAYRFRRILFPLIAGALAPGGGEALILSMALVSLAGVALGAWSATRLPRAPRWLPLSVAVNPGVGVALALSLSDALATGLTVAAVAAASRRRWTAMVLAATGAALTRETLAVVGLALALTPGLSRGQRIASAAVPAGAVGAWSLWSAHALGTPLLEGSGQVSLPFAGWLQAGGSQVGVLIGFLALALLLVATRHAWPREPHLAALLGAHAALVICLSPLVTVSWVNTSRVFAPVLPIALWVVFRRAPAEDPAPTGVRRPRPASAPA